VKKKKKTLSFAGYFTRLTATGYRRRIVEQECTDIPEFEARSQTSRRQKREVKKRFVRRIHKHYAPPGKDQSPGRSVALNLCTAFVGSFANELRGMSKEADVTYRDNRGTVLECAWRH
jgi:hypothetical protein